MTALISLDQAAQQMTPAGLVTMIFDRVPIDGQQGLIDALQRRLNAATMDQRLAAARAGHAVIQPGHPLGQQPLA